MKLRLLEFLRCPSCGGRFDVAGQAQTHGEVETGELRCDVCMSTYSIAGSVPRLVADDNYANSFGLQWNHFRKTQLDSQSGTSISCDRFYGQSGWDPKDLQDKLVLDVGCGAGRFTEIALAAGAEVVALDYSSAVDACWDNLGPNARLHVVQGDIACLPFPEGTFDFVYCFGVLQHTPEVRRSFRALPPMVRSGGSLAVDVYPRMLQNLLWTKYWLRPITKRMSAPALFRVVEASTNGLLRLSNFVSQVPLVGSRLRYLVPVANYDGVLPLSPPQLREWAILDTFDMLAPAHDHPQSSRTLREWFIEAGMTQVEIFRRGPLVGRGVA